MQAGRALAVACAAALAVAASPYAVTLDRRQCATPPPAVVAGLGPEWAPFASAVQRCAVRGPGGHVALTVDIVRLDRAAGADPMAGPQETPVPLPIMRDAAGRVVGTLPEQFPTDGPGRLKVRFVDWRDGVPDTVSLYQAGISALPPHRLPPQRRDRRTGIYR